MTVDFKSYVWDDASAIEDVAPTAHEPAHYVFRRSGSMLKGDKAIVGNASHMADALTYAMMAQPPVRKSWWRRHVVRRWMETKRRVRNAWAALRGEWGSDD